MEQGNVAKKLTGQILENWLLTLADGHGGIQTITKTGTSGLVDTYTIAFADETTSTFTVTNGRSISGLTTSKSGKVTTITITYNDNTTSSFTVRDGENVSSITEYWAVSTSGSQQPQSGWQTTPPTLTATYKYLWHYSKYTFSDGTNTSTTPAVQGVYGDKGDTGNTGTSITSVTKTGTSGLVDTYTITFSNGTTTTFNVTNGSEIESIEKTSTAGLVDTYTVTMGSGDTHTFTVTNGRSIVSFTQTSGTHAAGTIDVYTMTYNDGDTSQIQVYNGANGTGAVSTVAGIGVSSADGDVPLIIRGYGAPTTATVGQVNQLYFDMTGGIMYICIASAGGSYDWRGMSSAVDSAMSTTSANPLQNRVISNKVGVGSLSSEFSATNLTDAANELQTNKANLASPTFTGTPKAPTAAAGTNNTQLATTAFVQNIASDLNGAINNCVTNVKYNGGYLKKTINGTDSNIIQIQDTPTNDSSKLPSSKSVYNLNNALDSLHKIFTSVSELGLSGTPTLVAVAQAMPDGSMFISNASDVTMTSMTDYNEINVVLVCRIANGRIFALGARTYAGVTLASSDVYYASYASNSSTFNGWISLNRGKLDTSNFYYAANDTQSNAAGIFVTGLCTGDGTTASNTIRLQFEVPKSMANISTISVTSLVGTLRECTGGYIETNDTTRNWATQTSAFTVTATKTHNTLIRVDIQKKSGSFVKQGTSTVVAGNSSVSYFGAFTFKFT